MKPSICIEMIFTELSFARRIEEVARAGFRFVEFWDWRDKDLLELQEVCSSCAVHVSNFSGQRLGDLIASETHPKLLQDFLETLETAKQLKTNTLMVLTNELGEMGVVRNAYWEKTVEEKTANLQKGLELLLNHTPEGMTIVLEPLNTVHDHKGYFLSDVGRAADLVADLKDDRVRVLCDLYHQGMMGDDLLAIIERYIGQIGYFHVADFPGRHEPGTGSADWRGVLRAIQKMDYHGFVGFEYSPARSARESLCRIMDLWQSL